MVVTRPQAKAAFNHVLNTVLGRGDDSSLKSSLLHDGIEDIFALATIDTDTINALTYKDPNNAGQRLAVSRGDKALVRVFCDFILHRNDIGIPINDNWTGITQADFDSFRVDPNYVRHVSGRMAIPSPTTRSSLSAAKYFPTE